MKVIELIEQLKELDQNLEVHFSYNSGDYWKTKVTSNVYDVSIELVEYSDYHRQTKLVDYNSDNDDEGNGTTKEVVILK